MFSLNRNGREVSPGRDDCFLFCVGCFQGDGDQKSCAVVCDYNEVYIKLSYLKDCNVICTKG